MLGSATINAVNNVRHSEAYQEPIGASNTPTPATLLNGTIGGGFAAVDSTARFAYPPEQFTNGASSEGAGAVDSVYVQADVDVTAGAAAVTVVDGHITAATGGTYTCPQAVKAGEFCWVYLT